MKLHRCPECGEKFFPNTPQQTFCGQSCAAKYTNRTYPRRRESRAARNERLNA